MSSPVYIVAAAALSAAGFNWRGLARQSPPLAPSRQLATTHGAVLASEIPSLPVELDVDARAGKLMSYPARLGAIAIRMALQESGWSAPYELVAAYFGVGASAGAMPEINAMLGASIDDHRFSLADFGGSGLGACNPLFAFQLMNNFTLCHGAILQQLGGPNSAFFSRGTGTVTALSEACFVLTQGECTQALVGAADSALHPVTWALLRREQREQEGFIPGEAAAVLALATDRQHALASIITCQYCSALLRPSAQQQWLIELLQKFAPTAQDCLILAAWGRSRTQFLASVCEPWSKATRRWLFCEDYGDALAATPALAWVAALDLLSDGEVQRVMVITAGIDGGLGCVGLACVDRAGAEPATAGSGLQGPMHG